MHRQFSRDKTLFTGSLGPPRVLFCREPPTHGTLWRIKGEEFQMVCDNCTRGAEETSDGQDESSGGHKGGRRF